MDRVLICTDLDRTLLPNGHQPESPKARRIFATIAADPDITLAYVSGRDQQLLKNAIAEYNLPVPDYAIGDVGTTLYQITGSGWRQSALWQKSIATDWQGVTGREMAAMLHHLAALTLQEPEKQGVYKLSYYTSTATDPEQLKKAVADALARSPAKVSLVHSADEFSGIALFDILPSGATKLHAIRFLLEQLGIPPARAVYSGDSGNDLEVLTSEINATLVANTTPEVKQQAAAAAPTGSLYLAKGNFLNMNGNYCAGILEGLAHFIPEMAEKIRTCSEKISRQENR